MKITDILYIDYKKVEAVKNNINTLTVLKGSRGVSSVLKWWGNVARI